VASGARDGARPEAEAAAASELAAAAGAMWRSCLESDPFARTHWAGLPAESMPDMTFAAAQERAGSARDLLGRMERLDKAALDDDDRLTLESLMWDLEVAAGAPKVFWHTFQLMPAWNELMVTQLALEEQPLATAGDRERYLHLVSLWPRFFGQCREVLLEQRRRGVLVPRDAVPTLRHMIAPLATKPHEHSSWPATARLAGIDRAPRAAFEAALDTVLRDEVAPAARRTLTVFDDVYLRMAPSAIGLCNYPGGAEAYNLMVRRATTSTATPEELHQLGVSEVARLEELLHSCRAACGYPDLDASAFRGALRADPRLRPTSADEVGARLTRHLDGLDARFDDFFSRRPKAPAALRPAPEELWDVVTYGYYIDPSSADPTGYFSYNPTQSDPVSLLGIASLLFHELIPGHHLQLCLQSENEALPSFRRFAMHHDAFAEGWAEYASALAGEMGGYGDPLDLCGRLQAEMDMAIRLVLDTGLNALGWTRAQADAYWHTHSLVSEREAGMETLRYAVAMPAQALAYQYGHLRIRAMRAEAEAALGARFDIREFHDWVLGPGDVPLSVLEDHIRRRFSNDPGNENMGSRSK
jgi:uncharacterized protein (DUF885 family)